MAQVQEPLNLDELTKDLCGLKDGHLIEKKKPSLLISVSFLYNAIAF